MAVPLKMEALTSWADDGRHSAQNKMQSQKTLSSIRFSPESSPNVTDCKARQLKKQSAPMTETGPGMTIDASVT
jgi:hypothetical protein